MVRHAAAAAVDGSTGDATWSWVSFPPARGRMGYTRMVSMVPTAGRGGSDDNDDDKWSSGGASPTNCAKVRVETGP